MSRRSFASLSELGRDMMVLNMSKLYLGDLHRDFERDKLTVAALAVETIQRAERVLPQAQGRRGVLGLLFDAGTQQEYLTALGALCGFGSQHGVTIETGLLRRT